MFKELFTESEKYSTMSEKEILKDMLKQANKIALEVTLSGKNYVKFDGLEPGKIGAYIDEDSDAKYWERYPECIVYDTNTNEIEITANNYKATHPKPYDLIWKRFKGAFYSGDLRVGKYKMDGGWR